ncbi:MAG: hypothetical protein NZM15_01185 [Flavobacteriales bacterium]|nr:hypothetical protein [Flavobacteriales bacterium]MDW8431297.1 hypothetical protein [Flavobacteriales bacterium]
MKNSTDSMFFLLLITFLMMPPAGLYFAAIYYFRKKQIGQEKAAWIQLQSRISSGCILVLTCMAFVQVGLYVFTVTKGPEIIPFLDTIY